MKLKRIDLVNHSFYTCVDYPLINNVLIEIITLITFEYTVVYMSQRAGEGDIFATYYDEQPLIESSIDETGYQIYRIQDTHYAAYIHLPEVCVCMLETDVLPQIPVRERINFGPTEDNWIGFTTNGVSEYNYDANWNMLCDDRREEPCSYTYFDHDDINHWTPRLLESAVANWISQLDLADIRMQCSHT